MERLAAKSPEGTPAHPGAGPNAIAALLIVAIVVMTAAGLLVGFLWSPLAGLILGGIALVALLVSPAVWSAVLRAKERQEVVHE